MHSERCRGSPRTAHKRKDRVSMPTPPLALGATGAAVRDLHASLRKLGYTIPENELTAQTFGVGSRDAVLKLQTKYRMAPTGAVDEDTTLTLARAVAAADAAQYRIEGRVLFDSGIAAANVTIRLYNRGFAGVEKRLAEIKTDA